MTKLLEENGAVNLHDLGLCKGLSDITPKAENTKEKKIDKLDFIKMESFCASEDTIKEVKDTPQSGRKYLQIPSLIKDSYLEYIKSSYNSLTKRRPMLGAAELGPRGHGRLEVFGVAGSPASKWSVTDQN